MNVPFTLAKPDLDKNFCTEAAKVGLVNLEGHRSVGGMRAVHLQRDVDRRRRCADQIHEGLPGQERLKHRLKRPPDDDVFGGV